ncbi:MAG: energy-coupling factor transporter ATPase [Candidatus Zixiibacteriota bacterium]
MIQFINVDYTVGAFALYNISLSIKSGERVCVLGLNGSGKSTLLKLAAGLLKPTAGDVRIEGVSVHDEKDFHSRRADIGFIFQNPEDQLLTASVAADLAFTLENLAFEPAEINARLSQFAKRFRLDQLLNRHPATLSAGEKQRLALAATFISHPKILILDEPTSYLDESGRRLLADMIFATRDWSILAATQHPSEIQDFDRVIFLEDGAIVFDETAAAFSASPIYRKIESSLSPTAKTLAPPASGAYALEIRNLTFSYPVSPPCLREINLAIPSRQITAIVGDSGSGKTTLALLIAGLLKSTNGTFLIDGSTCSDDDRRTQVGIVFQIPEAAIFAETVFDEIAFGLRNQGVPTDQLSQRVNAALNRIGLDPNNYLARNPFTLSAGEQRLVAIASILALDRQIIIFDESTAGLDWIGTARIRELLQSLKSRGRTVIIISHDRKFVLPVANQTIGLVNKRIQSLD